MVHPIIRLNTLSFGFLMARNQSFDPAILDSIMNSSKKEEGNLILEMAKTCPKS